jgi:shikimate kinase
MNKHLVLVGMMGSGKSTVGRWLAERTGLPFVDTDARIEAREGHPISRIFANAGEAYFRDVERQVVAEVAADAPSVVATGGGVFVDTANRAALLRSGVVFYLKVAAEELAARTGKGTHRPLLHGKDHLAELQNKLAAREAFYAGAHHVIDAQRPVREIEETILGIWKKES